MPGVHNVIPADAASGAAEFYVGIKEHMKESGLIEIMKKRYSCRSYTGKPISVADRERLAELINQSDLGPFGSRPAFKLITSEPGDGDSLKGLGTYGFISKPAGFIIGSVNESPMYLETSGTAWRGSFFTQQE